MKTIKKSTAKLCYIVSIGTKKFYVQLNHIDQFCALYSGDTIIIEASLAWHRFPIGNNNIYPWYEKV